MNWLWSLVPCKRRFPPQEVPPLRKITRLTLSDAVSHPVLRTEEDLEYSSLISLREDSHSSLLSCKVRLLRTVLRRAELLSLVGTKDPGKRSPFNLSPADYHEAEE